MKKKLLSLLVAVAIIAIIAVGCAGNATTEPSESTASTVSQEETAAQSESAASTENEGGEYVIGVTLMDYNYTFFQDILASIKMHASEIGGIKIVDFDAKQDVTKQINDVQDMIKALKVNAIILNPTDSEALSSAVLEANEANIPVVTVDISTSEGDIYEHVASDNHEIGKMNGEECVRLLQEKYGEPKGTIVVLSWTKTDTMRNREQGFMDALNQYPDINVVVKYPIELSTEGCMNLCNDVFTAYPKGKIDIVAGLNSTSTLGFIAAAETAGRSEIQASAVDDDPDILANIADPEGAVQATVVQYPTDMGVTAVDYAVKAIQGVAPAENKDDRIDYTEIKIVNKDNIAEYTQEHDELEAKIAAFK